MNPENNIEFYQSLESIKSLDIWNIQRELNSATKNENGDWDENILTERKILFLNLNNGKLISNIFTTDLNGKVQGDVSFSELEYKYIEYRLEDSKNNWLKSRYAHLLWEKYKHKKFAESALAEYSACINQIKSEEARELSIILSAIFYISKNAKIDQEHVRIFAIELMKETPIWIKGSILREALHHNLLEKSRLVSIANEIETFVDFKNADSYFTNEVNLNIALPLFQKIAKSATKVYSLLAQNEDLIIKQHPNDDEFIKITHVGNKALYHKQAKEIEKYDATMREYNRLKESVKLNKISIPLGDDATIKFNEFLNLKSNFLLQRPAEEILAYFAENEELLVDSGKLREIAEGRVNKSFMHLLNTITFDINTNFKVLTEKEKIDKEVLDSYIISHNIQCYALFLKVFSQGIISGKLNYYNVYSFFEKYSWYGQKTKRIINQDSAKDNSLWLSLLAPGLHNLFAQYELSILLNTNKVNNFILAIDSLTLKFEGILRDFIRLCGGNTSKDKNGELKEQLLEELLENEIVIKYFSTKDIDLFKFTFTSRGNNIRNNVAHSFMEFSDYGLNVASLVFLCILRLGKYTLE
ncbi:DUF4209 domain-containing protein [Flavobacterium sp.]|jgi:hypothetical protein|uniref:DUF4209 domain-containing protein n=1 Tax=Flavobacterium sp. TaxID=239 RepID=UPI0022C86169|nr:DUF4209 domain-containing protein [Flavobacterium sp.]MCZ8145965.1 DUF4209 domain-containing protein [Flavobacterium sp.]MCZ8367753.1 DUF4209 domain-containing protein [Flavobacterium sp.]